MFETHRCDFNFSLYVLGFEKNLTYSRVWLLLVRFFRKKMFYVFLGPCLLLLYFDG